MMEKYETHEKIKLDNLLWRLKDAFSEFDGTAVKVSRMKSETEYLAFILKRALTQKEDFLIKQLALDLIRVLNRGGTREEIVVVGNVLATYKKNQEVKVVRFNKRRVNRLDQVDIRKVVSIFENKM